MLCFRMNDILSPELLRHHSYQLRGSLCLGFPLRHIFFIGISFTPHFSNRISVVAAVVVARKESQPAVRAASCAAASRLCRHSAPTPTPYNASVLSRVYPVPIGRTQSSLPPHGASPTTFFLSGLWSIYIRLKFTNKLIQEPISFRKKNNYGTRVASQLRFWSSSVIIT